MSGTVSYNLQSLQDEIERLKAGYKEQSLMFNEFAEKTSTKLNTLTSMVDLLTKENQQLKTYLASQRFEIHPVNNGFQIQASSNNNYQENFMSTPNRGRTRQGQAHAHAHVQALQAHQAQVQALAQAQQQLENQPTESTPSNQQQQQQQLIDGSINESNSNSGILRFINNQYVDDENALANQQTRSSSLTQRVDFVFMDPSSNTQRGFRAPPNNLNNNNGGNNNNSFAEDEDEDEDMTSMNQTNHTNQTSAVSSSSRPSKSRSSNGSARANNGEGANINTRDVDPSEADNFDLVIHNDFNKVEDIYYEFHNSLKPQVERISKAYKIKKIRKYQKIKALAVRIDRYKELKGCTLEESFSFFDALRDNGDESGTKKSIAWLYNTLPDVLRNVGLEDQLKGRGNAD